MLEILTFYKKCGEKSKSLEILNKNRVKNRNFQRFAQACDRNEKFCGGIPSQGFWHSVGAEWVLSKAIP